MEGKERQGKAAKVFSSSAEDRELRKIQRKIIDRRDYLIEAIEILS